MSGTHLGLATKFSLSFFNYFFTQLRGCLCGTPSLTRVRVCSLQLLLGLASGELSRVWVPRDSWSYFIVSVLRLPQLGEPGSCIHILQEQGSPVIPFGIQANIKFIITTGGPFCDPRPNFLLSLLIFRQFLICCMRRPLWREVESVVVSCCWASPA
jgi:hypothetical protein